MATQTDVELEIIEPFASSSAPHASSIPRTVVELGAEVSLTDFTADNARRPILSRTQTVIVISQLLGITLFGSFCNGVIVVGLPAIADALQLQEGLLLWPTTAYYLTAGSCVLMAGSIADVAGNKRVNLVGSFLGATVALSCGLARNGAEIIAFRALQGISNAIIVPSSISIISAGVEEGRPRNIGFACLGFASPIGFSLGLVLGGVFVNSVGWRAAFYLAGAASFVLFFVGIWTLPQDTRPMDGQSTWKRLLSEIDWVGATLASTGLATLSYTLAALSVDINSIHVALNITFLVVSAASVPAFIGWMHYRVNHNRPALIPNALWRNSIFTSSCIMVLFSTATVNCMELFSSLFFQEVQGNSAIEASLRLLPSLIAGALTNLSTGIFVNRMPVMWTVLISSGLCAVAPLLMALIRPEWPYWYDAFFAQILSPLSCDMLFTVGLLVVSNVFPSHMQALSGAVFNTCAQLGTAIGLTVTSVITASVTDASRYETKTSPDAIMAGYRAVFWTIFAWMLVVCLVCMFGLRKVGKIGVKRD